MTEWTFRLVISGLNLTDGQLDALFEAGCDDATFSRERDGSVLGLFDREADTEVDAVLSAIEDVEGSGMGVRVVRVVQDDDWLTASEIAGRLGRTRQSVNLLIRGERGPGAFPSPVARHRSVSPLWSWVDIAAWFEAYEPEAVPDHGPVLTPDFLAELNDRLDLRERHRRAPKAAWRARLDEMLPLGA